MFKGKVISFFKLEGEKIMSQFLQQIVNGLSLGSIYALIALGYTMVYGIIKLINFAHGDVYMIGAYTAFIVTTYFGFSFFQP